MSRERYLERALIATLAELEFCQENYQAQAEMLGCDAGNPDGGSEAACKHCQWLRGAETIGKTIKQARGALRADTDLAELVVKALAPSMDGEEEPHPDVAAAYGAAYRIVHGEPEPERDEATDLPF